VLLSRTVLRRNALPFVDKLIGLSFEASFFLCGLPLVMELSRSLLKEIGVEASRVLQESFGGGVSEEKPRPVGSGPLEVKLTRSALSYQMFSSDATRKLRTKWSINSFRLPAGKLKYLRDKIVERQGSYGQ
jgi:hypothetical protein